MEDTSVQTRAVTYGPHRVPAVAPAWYVRRNRSMARTLAIVSTVLVEAILILGLVVVSLGIGAERRPGRGADQPPALATPAASPVPRRLSPQREAAPGPGGLPTPGWPPGRPSSADSSLGSLVLARADE